MKTRQNKISPKQQFSRSLMKSLAEYHSRGISERIKRALAEKKLRSIKNN